MMNGYNDLGIDALVEQAGMMVSRKYLSIEDPESWPMMWVKKFGTIEGFDWVGCFGKEDAEDYENAFRLHRYGKDYSTKCPHCGGRL